METQSTNSLKEKRRKKVKTKDEENKIKFPVSQRGKT